MLKQHCDICDSVITGHDQFVHLKRFSKDVTEMVICERCGKKIYSYYADKTCDNTDKLIKVLDGGFEW